MGPVEEILFGFLSSLFLIFFSKFLGFLLRREEGGDD